MGEEVCASVIVKESVATFTEADIRAYGKGKVSFRGVG